MLRLLFGRWLVLLLMLIDLFRSGLWWLLVSGHLMLFGLDVLWLDRRLLDRRLLDWRLLDRGLLVLLLVLLVRLLVHVLHHPRLLGRRLSVSVVPRFLIENMSLFFSRYTV